MGERNVITVILVAVRNEKKILLLKRESEPLKGYWGLVGGKLKAEESIKEAALRETKEETGIDAEFVSIRGVLHERLYDENKKTKYGFVFFFVEVKPKTLEIESSHEGEVRWFDADNLEKENVILSDLWMVQNLIGEKAKVHEVIMKEKNGKLADIKVD